MDSVTARELYEAEVARHGQTLDNITTGSDSDEGRLGAEAVHRMNLTGLLVQMPSDSEPCWPTVRDILGEVDHSLERSIRLLTQLGRRPPVM